MTLQGALILSVMMLLGIILMQILDNRSFKMLDKIDKYTITIGMLIFFATVMIPAITELIAESEEIPRIKSGYVQSR